MRWILVLFAAGWSCFAAQDSYCAYEVRVTKPSGEPRPGISVLLVDAGHQIAESKTDEHGVVRFCDAPWHYVDIVAATGWCGQSVIRSVKPAWLSTRRVALTYNETDCPEFVVPDECHYLFRVVDQMKHPIPGIAFDGSRSQGGTRVSDSLGRIFQSARKDSSLQGVFSKAGYRPVKVTERCNGDDQERTIVMPRP